MTNKKTDKQDKNVKPSAGKSAATTKTAKTSDEKKPAISKTATTKTEKSAEAKKASPAKPTASKATKPDAKKPSADKSTATKTKKPVDTKQSTPSQADKSAPAAKTVKGLPVKPNPDEAMHLATQSMNHFITAKQERSMKHFYHTVAKVWQDMTTVEKLDASFATIIADTSDWNFLKEIWPTLIKDGLSERGDWVVVGVYPTKPKKLIFDQIFVSEEGEWKIAELKLYTAD